VETLKLIGETDPILRKRCVEWDFKSSADITILVRALLRLKREYGGIGLAANQIGVPYRCFVMGNESDKHWVCINPEIISRSGKIEKEPEGCLSFPNLVLDIERSSVILVRYSTETGETVEEELTGIWAKCFQHELDHLDGICFDTRVSKLALGMALRKRAKAEKRKRNG
jgi:peptide deformylase